MLTPGEVTQASGTSQNSRGLNETGNIDIHVHAIFGPLRNTSNTHQQAQNLQGNNPINSNTGQVINFAFRKVINVHQNRQTSNQGLRPQTSTMHPSTMNPSLQRAQSYRNVQDNTGENEISLQNAPHQSTNNTSRVSFTQNLQDNLSTILPNQNNHSHSVSQNMNTTNLNSLANADMEPLNG